MLLSWGMGRCNVGLWLEKARRPLKNWFLVARRLGLFRDGPSRRGAREGEVDGFGEETRVLVSTTAVESDT